MHPTIIRTLSALILALIVLGLYLFWNNAGLIALVFLTMPLLAWEFSYIAFNHLEVPAVSKVIFIFSCISLFAFSSTGGNHLLLFPLLSCFISFYLTINIWLCHNRMENQKFLQYLSLSTLGFVYCGLFTTTIVKILNLSDGQGPRWFLLLLLIVFAGDIFAFFIGKHFGRHKLAETLSPKKTVEGALGGLLGSIVIGLIAKYFMFPQINPILFILLCLVLGLVAQSGDLFESLIKRVGQLKDSGKIIPGHGGLLDRLDGLLLASPVLYIFIIMLSYF